MNLQHALEKLDEIFKDCEEEGYIDQKQTVRGVLNIMKLILLCLKDDQPEKLATVNDVEHLRLMVKPLIEDIERRLGELELREQRRTYNDVCEDLKKEPSNDEGKEWKCPHCGSNRGTWFDRTLDEDGDMTTRCDACGKDIDEKPSPAKQAEHKCSLGCGRTLEENQLVCSCQLEDEDGVCECDKQPAKVEQTISISRTVAEEWLKEEIYMNEHNEGMLSELRTALAQEKEGK